MKMFLTNFVLTFLGLWAQGTLGFVGLGKEGTWGTPVAATDYFEIQNESLSLGIDRFPTRNAYAGFHEADDQDGARRITGDIVVAAHPVNIGVLLKAALFTVSGSTILSGFLYRSRFISTKSDWIDGASVRVPGQGYTVEVHRDITSSHRYAGGLCTGLVLNVAGNQELRATSRWLAKSPSMIARSAPTFPSSPEDPFTWDSCSLALGGSATTRWESLTVEINNQLAGHLGLANTNEIVRSRRGGDQQIRISGVLDFIDLAEYEDFRQQTVRQLQANFFIANSFNMLIDAPRFKYHTFPVGIPGRDRLTIGFTGAGHYSSTSGVAIDIGLTSTKSDY